MVLATGATPELVVRDTEGERIEGAWVLLDSPSHVLTPDDFAAFETTVQRSGCKGRGDTCLAKLLEYHEK